jgi:hypothetical protein
MLDRADKEKIERYVDKVIGNISSDVKRNMKNGMKGRDVIDSTVRLTVNKITPESKMIMSSTYNMLTKKTLADDLYKNPHNKAAFYSAGIQSKLESKFSFEVPDHIDYDECSRYVNKWSEAGVTVAAEGIVSIAQKTWAPVVVSVVLVAIMLILRRNQPVNSGKQDASALVQEYLETVKKLLLQWVDEIAKFYDSEIEKLEKEIK